MNIRDFKFLNEAKCELVEKLREVLKDFPHQIYVVGGWVRDLVAGITKNDGDLDLVVDVEDGETLLADYLYKVEGISVVKDYRINRFAIAQLSIEGVLGDLDLDICMSRGEMMEGALGLFATYGNLKVDAMRRDFSINSLYLNVETGEILDPTGKGLSDLEKNILRPLDLTDPMRLFRAARFDAMGFKLSVLDRDLIAEKAIELRDKLYDISDYRKYHEFNKLIKLDTWATGVENLHEFGLLVDVGIPDSEGIDIDKAKYMVENDIVDFEAYGYDLESDDMSDIDLEYWTKTEALKKCCFWSC